MSDNTQREIPARAAKSFTVRDLPAEERPRERLAEHGAQACLSGRQALSSAELLESCKG